MTARCKFKVVWVQHHAYGGRRVRLEAAYDQPLSQEDRSFSKMTPSGFMEIEIQNPIVFDVFTPGKNVYIDVTAVE